MHAERNVRMVLPKNEKLIYFSDWSPSCLSLLALSQQYLRVKVCAKKWLGDQFVAWTCAPHPDSRGTQETRFTQPRDHSFAQPCTYGLWGTQLEMNVCYCGRGMWYDDLSLRLNSVMYILCDLVSAWHLALHFLLLSIVKGNWAGKVQKTRRDYCNLCT